MLSCSSIYSICLLPMLFSIICPVLDANTTKKNPLDESENDENNE